MDLLHSTLIEIRNAIAEKKISAEEVVVFFNSRSRKLNATLNAFITFNEKAIEQARVIDQKISRGEKVGKLAGVPIAVKDLLCTKGVKTTAGSKILHNFIPPYSATIVERLEAEGAIIIGKLNLDEFAMGSSNETSAFGAVKNPWNLKCVSGGSSGGSAAAVAARMVPAAIGTDTGGSIRQPASFCGIVGVKPTYGRVSRYGVVAYASSLDQAGPMTYDTKDAALVLEVISGHDKKDSTSSEKAVPALVEAVANKKISSLRIGVPKEYFEQSADVDTAKIVKETIEKLKRNGAQIVDVSLPLTKYAVAAYYIIATSEASSNLARYDGVRFGHRSKESTTIEELYCKSRSEGFGKEVKARIMLGTYVLSSGYYDAYYLQACKVRRQMLEDYKKAFQVCDVLLTPVTTSPAFQIGEKINDPMAMYLNDIYTTATNLAGLPGMSVPAGVSTTGLPIGVQVTANHFEEEKMLMTATLIEKLCALEKKVPNVDA